MGSLESPRNFQARGDVNQRSAKIAREGEIRLFGASKKQQRADKDRIFRATLVGATFEKALGRFISGRPTLEDAVFIRRHQAEFSAPEGVDLVTKLVEQKDKLYS